MGVFCYGELGVDNLIRVPHLPSPEVASFPTTETYHIGGAAANTAVWLARWNTPVTLAGNHIGLDLYGEKLRLWLENYPTLNLEYLEQREAVTTPFCRVMVTPDGERSFLIFGYPEAPKTPLIKAMLATSDYLALDLYGGDERLAAARVAHEAGIATVVGDVIRADHDILPMTSIATNAAAYIRQVFPEADIKIFLTAGADVRAERRHKEMIEKGHSASYEEVLENIMLRDQQDSTREASPLARAGDAVDLDNSSMTIDEQMEWFERLLASKRKELQ